jgi:lipopolysaccharide transport system ATP-binding protein
MSQPIIEVRGLSKRYQLGAIGATSLRDEASRLWGRVRGTAASNVKEFWALRDVSFDVQAGEVVGVIGRNGAGKSTLLKILSRITEPTGGTAKLRGRVASLLEVGTGFHPELTGRENIFLNGAILGMSRAEIRSKFDEIVAFAEVDQFIDTPVKRYSSGMYVRLAFAVAAHLEPEILIVDEVLAVGDAAFQQKCLSKMDDVSRNAGRTIFLVSHNLDSILRLSTHVLWLQQGRLQESGRPNLLIDRYARTARTSAVHVPLGEIKRADFTLGRARFTAIEHPETKHAWAFEFGREITFLCHVRLSRSFASLSIAYAIFSMTGFEIASTRTTLVQTAPAGPGECVIQLTIGNFRLAPGSYSLNLGLRSDAGEEDFLANIVTFEVATNPLAAAEFADTVRAAVIPPAKATLHLPT